MTEVGRLEAARVEAECRDMLVEYWRLLRVWLIVSGNVDVEGVCDDDGKV